MTTSPKDTPKTPSEESRRIVEEIFNTHPRSSSALVAALVRALDAIAKAERERTIRECADIVDDAIGDESDNQDEQRGHLRSMHIGAMDALRPVHEAILALLEKNQ